MAEKAGAERFVRGVPLFSGLLPSELDRVAMVMARVEEPAGEVLCAEGGEGHDFFVIAEGEAVVERSGRSLAKLGSGDYFGELAILDRHPRSATVKAVTDVRLYVLHEASFVALLAELPALAQKLLANLASRLREAELRLDQQSLG
jgi:CRP/FNR family cyclic AMP-dependent transcriptional regulator